MNWHQVFIAATPDQREKILQILIQSCGEEASPGQITLLDKFDHLPLPIRMGLINTFLSFFAFFSFPPPPESPPIVLPLIWAGSYCLTLTIVSLLHMPMNGKG